MAKTSYTKSGTAWNRRQEARLDAHQAGQVSTEVVTTAALPSMDRRPQTSRAT
jgi:hypothetical protein